MSKPKKQGLFIIYHVKFVTLSDSQAEENNFYDSIIVANCLKCDNRIFTLLN